MSFDACPLEHDLVAARLGLHAPSSGGLRVVAQLERGGRARVRRLVHARSRDGGLPRVGAAVHDVGRTRADARQSRPLPTNGTVTSRLYQPLRFGSRSGFASTFGGVASYLKPKDARSYVAGDVGAAARDAALPVSGPAVRLRRRASAQARGASPPEEFDAESRGCTSRCCPGRGRLWPRRRAASRRAGRRRWSTDRAVVVEPRARDRLAAGVLGDRFRRAAVRATPGGACDQLTVTSAAVCQALQSAGAGEHVGSGGGGGGAAPPIPGRTRTPSSAIRRTAPSRRRGHDLASRLPGAVHEEEQASAREREREEAEPSEQRRDLRSEDVAAATSRPRCAAGPQRVFAGESVLFFCCCARAGARRLRCLRPRRCGSSSAGLRAPAASSDCSSTYCRGAGRRDSSRAASPAAASGRDSGYGSGAGRRVRRRRGMRVGSRRLGAATPASIQRRCNERKDQHARARRQQPNARPHGILPACPTGRESARRRSSPLSAPHESPPTRRFRLHLTLLPLVPVKPSLPHAAGRKG